MTGSGDITATIDGGSGGGSGGWPGGWPGGGIRTTTLLAPTDVVDDEVLHPGAVVWLAEPRLGTPERERFALAARRAAMARHPAGRRRHLRAV